MLLSSLGPPSSMKTKFSPTTTRYSVRFCCHFSMAASTAGSFSMVWSRRTGAAKLTPAPSTGLSSSPWLSKLSWRWPRYLV